MNIIFAKILKIDSGQYCVGKWALLCTVGKNVNWYRDTQFSKREVFLGMGAQNETAYKVVINWSVQKYSPSTIDCFKDFKGEKRHWPCSHPWLNLGWTFCSPSDHLRKQRLQPYPEPARMDEALTTARNIHGSSPGGKKDSTFCSWGNGLHLIRGLAETKWPLSDRLHSLCPTPCSQGCLCDIKNYWVWSREIWGRGGRLFWQAWFYFYISEGEFGEGRFLKLQFPPWNYYKACVQIQLPGMRLWTCIRRKVKHRYSCGVLLPENAPSVQGSHRPWARAGSALWCPQETHSTARRWEDNLLQPGRAEDLVLTERSSLTWRPRAGLTSLP